MGWNIIAILGGLGGLATIITLLASRVDEGSVLARILTWLQRWRKEREALERRISELEERVGVMVEVLAKESELRDEKHTELAQLVADLKLRADADGKRLTDMQGNILHDAQELNALGTKQKRVETQLELQDQMLHIMQDLIAELRQHDNGLLAASATDFDALDMRLRKLEGSPPAGYQGKVLPPIIFEPDDSTS